MHSYHTEQLLLYPLERVFAFFADPNNLPSLMPAWQHARIEERSLVAPPAPPSTAPVPTAAAGAGSQIALSFRPLPYSPIRVRWQAEIAEFAWNHRFCDRQVRGPFAYWKHCHRVESVSRHGVNGTLIVDDVEYELPFGAAGELAHRLFLRRQIERTFAFRQAQLAKIFAALATASQPT